MKKYSAAVLAVFIFLLVWNYYLSDFTIGSAVATLPGLATKYYKMWEAAGDLATAMVAVGVYARTRKVFGEGVHGGAVFGAYAGVLMNFPLWLNMSIYFSWPYRGAWALTIVYTSLSVVLGAIAGLVYQIMGRSKTV